MNKYCGYKVLAFICFSFLVFSASLIFTVEVKLEEKIQFKNDEAPKNPRDLYVLDDGLFIVTDYADGSIRLYSREGISKSLRLKKRIGTRGVGPEKDNFGEPAYCTFDKSTQRFIVMDYGKREIVVLELIDMNDFRYVGKYSYPKLGYDLQVWNNSLVISGEESAANGDPVELFAIDLTPMTTQDQKKSGFLTKADTKVNFYLTAAQKYGLLNRENYLEKRDDSPQKKLGRKGWFDIDENTQTLYYAYECSDTIFKLDLQNGKVEEWTRLMQNRNSSHYIIPKLTDEMKINRDKGDVDAFNKAKASMSFVKDLFVGQQYIFLVVESPTKQEGKTLFWLQSISFDGATVDEDALKESKPSGIMFFDIQRGTLYAISKSGDSLLRYVIHE